MIDFTWHSAQHTVWFLVSSCIIILIKWSGVNDGLNGVTLDNQRMCFFQLCWWPEMPSNSALAPLSFTLLHTNWSVDATQLYICGQRLLKSGLRAWDHTQNYVNQIGYLVRNQENCDSPSFFTPTTKRSKSFLVSLIFIVDLTQIDGYV